MVMECSPECGDDGGILEISSFQVQSLHLSSQWLSWDRHNLDGRISRHSELVAFAGFGSTVCGR